jgi:adenylyl cyclase-associated protein
VPPAADAAEAAPAPIQAPVKEREAPVTGTTTKIKKRIHSSGWKHWLEVQLIEAGIRNDVCIDQCVGSSFSIDSKEGKFKSLVVTGCHDCEVKFPSTVGNVELINCTKISVVSTGAVPIFQIDGCDRVFVTLEAGAHATQLFTSKSSSVNVRRPGDNDFVEVPLPEQIRHTFDANWQVTSAPVSIQ